MARVINPSPTPFASGSLKYTKRKNLKDGYTHTVKARKTKLKGPWDNFPGCHICQGMKKGRGRTEEDLRKLFAESEAKQTVKSEK